MKKDIGWLKEEIKKLITEESQYMPHDEMVDLGLVLSTIDQLDESELTQDQVDKYLYERNFVAVDAMMVHQMGIQNKVVIEKPVIPKFVADYIELNKGWSEDRQEYVEDDSSGLWFALNSDSQGMPNSVSDWLFNEEQVETFAKAWLDGYEVEKEPHYYVAFEGEFNLLYVTHVDIYGEDGKFNYSSVFDKKHALRFTDKSKAEYLADFLDAYVVEA